MRLTKAILLVVLTCLILVSPSHAQIVPISWPDIIAQTELSIYKLQMTRFGMFGDELVGYCTGWSINELKGFIVTAAHCEGENMLADGHKAEILYVNTTADLMILQVSEGKKPSIKPSTKIVKKGDELLAIGYGYGFTQPVAKQCKVAVADLVINEIEEGERFLIADCAYIGGMSGGPVVNSEGKVISIVQLGSPDNATGLGRVLKTIRDVVGYFGRE